MDSKSAPRHVYRVTNRDKNLVELGQRIRDARKALGFSQEDLAHESGIDRSYIGGVERGDAEFEAFVEALQQVVRVRRLGVVQNAPGAIDELGKRGAISN